MKSSMIHRQDLHSRGRTHPLVPTCAQWIFLAVLVAQPTGLLVMKLLDQRPAADYLEAMANGQYRRASEFISSEAADNNPRALNALANQYYLGLGVEQDYAHAASLYHAAASQGYAPAELNLGHLYKQGLGVDKSVERAFAWYVHSDIADNPWAEYYMSQISVELTLTPLQMATIREKWRKLDRLAAEPL